MLWCKATETYKHDLIKKFKLVYRYLLYPRNHFPRIIKFINLIKCTSPVNLEMNGAPSTVRECLHPSVILVL